MKSKKSTRKYPVDEMIVVKCSWSRVCRAGAVRAVSIPYAYAQNKEGYPVLHKIDACWEEVGRVVDEFAI